MRDLTGIQTRVDSQGVEHFRGRVKDRGRWVAGPWRLSYADARGDRIRMQARKLDAPLTSTSETLAEAAARFLALAGAGTATSRRGTRYAPKTVRGYEQAFRDWILPELGHIHIDKLRRTQVQRWVDWLCLQREPGTVRNTWAALAALYSWLSPRHDDLVDPTHGVRRPPPARPHARYAPAGAIPALLGALDEDLGLPYAFAFYAGLRLGEIQGLRWEDIADGWITVRRSLDYTAGWVPPKSGRERSIPVFAPLVPYLIPEGSGSVIPSGRARWGVLTLGSTFNRRCHDCWTAADLDPVGLHIARHSFVTALVRAGEDIKNVQEWAGHADVATTLKIYVKHRERETGAAEKMDTYLNGAR